ncbi:ribonuclease H-like YkuK family protein [Tumebacillus sp. ITR2]|uniref:Ribonuclease H-like YkuK family protein n=1 Tax=Tumebacillus amylolyticus TaxID=2801339 RepID=A0ABS1JFK8_9BACL|nr:ribonuclease H-like YkuK family protein [Tumebacillus amylolyticus]MBL0389072.1 ribonuclease H-like YkuK family protein [Tumebacillus amylolyticus]
MDFVNPTRGNLSLPLVVRDMLDFIGEAPESEYRIIIGSDSQNKESRHRTTFVTAIIVHRIGKGARYYFHRRSRPLIKNMRQRIFTEASLSLLVCGELREQLALLNREQKRNLEVHLDVGRNGATQALIKELTSWVEGSGYEAKIKPDSYVASKVADRYTRV